MMISFSFHLQMMIFILILNAMSSAYFNDQTSFYMVIF